MRVSKRKVLRPVLTPEIVKSSSLAIQKNWGGSLSFYELLGQDCSNLMFNHSTQWDDLLDGLLKLNYWKRNIGSRLRVIDKFKRERPIKSRKEFRKTIELIRSFSEEHLLELEKRWSVDNNITPALLRGVDVTLPCGAVGHIRTDKKARRPASYVVLTNGEQVVYPYEEIDRIFMKELRDKSSKLRIGCKCI
ncbi:hypothetical protein VCHA53O466_50339 [Vibrio chagasii]|nr:hypothetical protein VCHA53O466_50339 [Vibrio chagasii]